MQGNEEVSVKNKSNAAGYRRFGALVDSRLSAISASQQRIEAKLDQLIDALAEDDFEEAEPIALDLDGVGIGREREKGAPL